MSLSHAIALSVASVLIIACLYLFIRIPVRGGFETSGYEIHWKSNPTGIVIVLVSLLVCPGIIVYGLITRCNSAAEGHYDPYIIFLGFEPGTGPTFDYEGSGVLRKKVVTRTDDEKFQFSYSVMSLPPGVEWRLDGLNDRPQYRIFDLSGCLSCSNGSCSVDADLNSRTAGRLVIAGTGREIVIVSGTNHIAVSWMQQEALGKERLEQ